MTVDNIKEEGAGIYNSRAWAEHAAQQLRAEGRETKIVESNLHLGCYVLYATPKLPEDTSSTVVEDTQEPIVEDLPPIDLSNQQNRLHTYRSLTIAESAAQQFRSEGRATKIEPSQLHKNQWVVHSTRLPGE